MNYPYNMYLPNSYTPYTPQPQPTPALTGQQPTQTGIVWVDGEVGAKAHQLPAGWPANTPMPLWDTNDTIIYLKSTNPMGMPNPLQRLHYTLEDQPVPQPMQERKSATPALMSGEYVTKDDLERMKEELREMMTSTPTVKKGGVKNESAV